jgi:splicing factor U2AF subunit
MTVYINRERNFAFVELNTIELTTACLQLDGIKFNGQSLRIRRPNDYNPSVVPPYALIFWLLCVVCRDSSSEPCS